MKTKPNQTLKVKIEEILFEVYYYGQEEDGKLVGCKKYVDELLALFESVIPKKVKPYAWNGLGEVTWDDGDGSGGYNQCIDDIRQKIGESKRGGVGNK